MPTSITQTTPLPSKAPSGKSIIFVSNGLAATERIATGVHEAADAIGWSYSEIHFDAANPATLESALLTALAKKPSAVTEAGSPQSTFGTSTIAAYKAANVPIILGSVAPIQLGDPIYGTPAGAASEQVVGKDLADWFIANSDGKGKALLENYTSAPVLNVFRDAFIAEVKALCPDCSTKVVAGYAGRRRRGHADYEGCRGCPNEPEATSTSSSTTGNSLMASSPRYRLPVLAA